MTRHQQLRSQQGAIGCSQNKNIAGHVVSSKKGEAFAPIQSRHKPGNDVCVVAGPVVTVTTGQDIAFAAAIMRLLKSRTDEDCGSWQNPKNHTTYVPLIAIKRLQRERRIAS
jgi:hypothetical protein